MVITNEADWPRVTVRMSAPNDVFAQLRTSELRATVDLSRATPGEARYRVQVPQPDPLVRSNEPNPNTISVRLEEITRKTGAGDRASAGQSAVRLPRRPRHGRPADR